MLSSQFIGEPRKVRLRIKTQALIWWDDCAVDSITTQNQNPDLDTQLVLYILKFK